MFKKLFFIAILFLFTSICANTENQTTSNIESTQQESSSIKNNSKDLDYFLELYANDKWRFMGKKFIDEWKNTFDKNKAVDDAVFLNVLFMFLFDPIIIIGSFIALVLYSEKHYWTGRETAKTIIATLIAEIILIIILHHIANKKLNSQMDDKVKERNYWTIKHFLNNWQKYKHITPKELYPLFEKLIPIFDELKRYDDTKIIEEIQQQVRDNQSVYYEQYKQSITKPPVINNYYYH
ncbi:MAG: hypothetical protein ABIA74_04975 [bacterium]